MPISHAVPGSAMLENIKITPGYTINREATKPAGVLNLSQLVRERKKG